MSLYGPQDSKFDPSVKELRDKNISLMADREELAVLALHHGIISRARFSQLLGINRYDIDGFFKYFFKDYGRKK